MLPGMSTSRIDAPCSPAAESLCSLLQARNCPDLNKGHVFTTLITAYVQVFRHQIAMAGWKAAFGGAVGAKPSLWALLKHTYGVELGPGQRYIQLQQGDHCRLQALKMVLPYS
eukprot:5034506-Pleurochrysis_carterae.AAC.1